MGERCIQSFGGETGGKKATWKTEAQMEGYKMDIQEVGWVGMDWIDLAQDMNRQRSLVNAVMNLGVP